MVKVKVTILASEWGSSKGGLSTLNRELAIQLAKCPEVEITFYLPKCSQEDKEEAHQHNVKIVEAKPRPGFEHLTWLCFAPEDLQIDIIVGHGVKLGKQAQIIKEHKDCKWVQVVHTDPEELGMFKSYSNPIQRGEEKHKTEVELCEMADFVVGVGSKLSEVFRSYLCGCPKHDDVFHFTPGIFEEFADVKHSVPSIGRQLIVLLFGRGDKEDFELKGFDIAGKAVAALQDTRLMFVGAPDGEHEEIAKRFTECGVPANRLRVRGFVQDRESLKRLFQEVSLLVMPSRSEGFGLTGLEALSAGLPVLVTGNSGFGEALCSLPFGSLFVITSDDPADWTSAIEKICAKDWNCRLEEAETLRHSYDRKYNWRVQIEVLINKMISWVHGDFSNSQSSSKTRGCWPKTSRRREGRPEPRPACLHLKICCKELIDRRPGRAIRLESRETASVSSTSNQWQHVATANPLDKMFAPVESQEEFQGAAAVRDNSGTPQVEVTSGSGREKDENGAVPSPQEVLRLIAFKYLRKVDLSTPEEFNGFVRYIEKVRQALIVDVTPGSLIVKLECSSLEILEGLWEDYCTGYLNRMAQKFLVTEEILEEFDLVEVKLTTTIKKEEYRACQELLSEIAEIEEPWKQAQEGNENPAPSQGACGTSANANLDDHLTKQGKKGRGRGASLGRGKEQVTSSKGKRKNSDKTNQAQRLGTPGQGNKNPGSSTQENRRPSARGVFPGKNAFFDPKAVKSKDSTEIVHTLNEGLSRLKFLFRSQDQQHNNDEFICDLTSTIGKACNVPPGKNINKILATLKGSAFFNSKIPSLLDRLQESTAFNDQVSRQRFIEHLIEIFVKYLTHLPSSYADLPYAQLKAALDQSSVDKKEELQAKLDEFKQARNDVIRGERQRHGKRFVNRAGEKPPNDFRDMAICPETKEITTQERPFLRKNISKGRYDNAEHYLDVQFRLLREDFLEPLREGIREIVLNIPRHQRKQLMKNYRGVKIVGKEFTWSGITHQVQIDVSGLDTSRWAHSKRLLYGSFLCLSKDNFKTMLFATVCDRDPMKVKKGRIDVRFIENQDVFEIEKRNCVYQMVESPAYFEAYQYVLKGLQELDETTLPFKKYLVECSGEVDPPEYLRRDENEEPVYYELGEALHMLHLSNSISTILVLKPEAWPSVEGLPLNKSQLEALKTAITTEFSVIQGPPGTGKTYVGAKIVPCLLDNRRAWDPGLASPMLMVCYTNHALDQFLEKVLEFLPSRKIIRVGGRCKSDKLENCNLKKFTYRYRLHGKREEVNEKLLQNDKEMKMSKQQLAKADHQLLEFEDVEQLINPAHLQQLCNAKFPFKVANESRTPSNTFKLWLCNNKEMACNQTSESPTHEKCVESEEKELFYDTTMFTEPQDESERFLGEPLAAANVSNGAAKPDLQKKMSKSEPLEPLAAGNVTNDVAKPDLQQMNTSEQRKLTKTLNASGLPSDLADEQNSTFLREQMEFSASQDVSQLNHSSLEHTASIEGADFIQGTESTEVEGKPSDANVDEKREADEETIAIEKEADLIQQQRWIQGDEDLLLPISKETGDLMSEGKKKGGANEENDKWTLVTHKKKGQSHFWMANDEEYSKEDGKLNDEETGGTMSLKKKKKRKKKNKKKVQITEDIHSIQGDLNKIEMMSTEEVMGVQNIWNMSQSDRLRLYLFWIENYREHYRVEIHHAERAYEQLCEELKGVQFEEEEQVIRQATVVGMTTSGAARYHLVLQRIAPKIVVIEEAAEVMEAHIITSLSHNTKHTILIGDHKQLRPKATVYELAQKYNLEVSLFERMVLNSMDCKRLSIQHRMRPEIATLTKRIYDHEIVDHDSVCNFPPISGLCHNLFFIDHCQPEKLIGGLQSYSNHHEAEFLVALCEYLLLQGYERKQITILTMYTGQLLLLQEKMPRRAFEGVKVCAVDNFQGEENDIILLSLVRSNSEGRIGFLGESNRICVALSRARQGFYCIGNFHLLKSQCKLWKEICDDLKTKEAIGDNLQLICKRHKNVTNVRWAREFKQCELGGCTMPCADRLECGHACDKLCHVSDVYHALGRCIKMCFNSCSSGHKCHNKCHYPRECPKCSVLVRKTPACGHEQSLRCSIDPDDVSSGFKCERKVIKILPCGHNNLMKCYKDPIIYSDCTSSCTKVLDCGHTCSERCTQKCQCGTKIEIQLPCNHSQQVLCREKNNPIDCNEKCERALNCGHACPGICHEECATKLCKIEVLKDLPCGHQQIVPCSREPHTVFCSSACQRLLNCGHKCPSLCGRLCQEIRCKELCQKRCQRDHPCQKQCHYGSSCGECTVPVNAIIATCGHMFKVPCFINQATLICKQPCERLRSCGHPCNEICGKDCETRPCQIPVTRTLSCRHVVDLACHKSTETFICKTKVDVLLPCGHKTSLECHVVKAGLNDVLCIEKVEKELRCGHKATLPCYTSAAQYCCQKKVEITLSCGHKKITTCSGKVEQFQSGICNAKVKRRLPCGHEKEMHCSDKAEKIFCSALCERILPCEHPCGNRCGDDCASFRCAVGVKKALRCGHHDVGCLCSEDVSQRVCSNPCTRSLSCGHQCPGKCYERCSQYKCQTLVVKKLPCAGNHYLKMFCKDDPNSVACQARCDRKLDCGHPCPGVCSQACGAIMCRRKVVKEYGCGHKQPVPCFESKTAICKAPCPRREGCTHECKGFCGVPCSKYPCQVPLVKTLPCGHKVKMPCSFSVDDVQCPASCQTQLPCGHECSGTCGECKQRGSHEICQNPCNRVLVCSHRCQATCGMPCPPCVRKCSRRCPHSKCPKQCLQPCRQCIKPCTWICPHYQCNNPCGEECDRPRCDAPCPKKLPCRHPCIGLCGENCPTVCAVCHSKTLSSMIGQGNFKATEATRYLQLLDCGHIVKVQEMDEWMLQDMGGDVNQIRCPRCSIPITFSYRYGNIVKRTLRHMENVKNQIREIGNETTRFTRELLRKLRHPPKGILTVAGKLSGRPGSTALYNVQMHHIPFVFTLRNSLLIMHQIERAYFILQAVEKCQDQLQVTDHSRTIKDALEKISDYLTTPQFDLATLSQLYEHTRTFTLFSSILEAQCQVITYRGSFSSIGVSRLKSAQERFELFMQRNSEVLQNEWLEKIVASLRNEVHLPPPPTEEPKEFKNFPGYNTTVWKLCKQHGQVYLTTSFMREGEEVIEVSGCRQCDGVDDSDGNTG